MLQDGFEGRSIVGTMRQAFSDQILDRFRGLPTPLQLALENLFVLLEWNIAANHVEEQDAQRPDSSPDSLVAVILDPFGRTVHARTIEIGVELVFEYGPRPEVDEFEVS